MSTPSTPSGVKIQVREICSPLTAPSAPPLAHLFEREGGVRPAQCIVLWEPAHNWPYFSIAHLVTGETPVISELRLRREHAEQPLAVVQHTVLATPDGQDLGVVWVRAAASDPLAAHVAITLLEQAERPAVLAGGTNDRQVERRLADFLRVRKWAGQEVLMVAPLNKPSRAERLRRLSWPKSVRVHILEAYASEEPDWSLQLVARLSQNAELAALARERAGSAPSRQPLIDEAPSEPDAVAEASAMPATIATELVDATSARAALDVAASTPGVLACSVTDFTRDLQVAVAGDASLVDSAAHDLVQLWRSQERLALSEPVNELLLSRPTQHHIALPIERCPGLLLTAVVSREFGDLERARWQLGVALNQIG